MFFWRKKNDAATAPEPKPSERFDDPSRLFAYFKSLTGIHFANKETITLGKMKNFALRHELYNFDDLLHALESDPELRQEFIDLLTVNETFFFRESEHISRLCEILKERHSSVRILCAPTSTGEEVYSIILALYDAGIAPEMYEIIGVDINASAIARAREGIFSERSVDRVDNGMKGRFFERVSGGYRINSSIRTKADFRQYNIFDPQFAALGTFDVIFSRNLFIYFNEEQKNDAVTIFCRMLRQDGVIFFGHADVLNTPSCLVRCYENGAKYYKKS